MISFGFQEWFVVWSVWGLGWERNRQHGWGYDEIVVFIGPVRLLFLGERPE